MTIHVKKLTLVLSFGVPIAMILLCSVGLTQPNCPLKQSDVEKILESPAKTNPLFSISAAYRDRTLLLLIDEATRVATALGLPEKLPLCRSNVTSFYIAPPHLSGRLGGALGSVATEDVNEVYIPSSRGFSLFPRSVLLHLSTLFGLRFEV